METRWSSTTKLVILVIVLLFFAWLLARFSDAIPPLLVAFILAYLLTPPTDWIVRRTGMPRGLAILFVYLILLLIVAIMPVVVSPAIVSIASSINFDVESFAPLLDALDNNTLLIGPVVVEVGEVLSQALQGLQSLITPFATGAVQVVAGVASSLFWLIFVFVVIFWLIKDSYKMQGWVLDRVPVNYRPEISQLFRELGVIWGGFFRGELVLGITIGIVVGLSMWILGLDHILLLAIIAGLMEFIPTIGPVVAAIPAILIAWFSGSSWMPVSNLILVLIVILVYLFIFQMEQLYLLPRIVGRRVRLHPGLVFVGTILGAIQFGILGVLLAAPVIASVRLLGNYIYRKMLDLDPFSTLPGTDPGTIEWRGMIRGQPISAVLLDFDGTIVNTDDDMIESWTKRLGPLVKIFPQRNPRPFLRHILIMLESPVNWLIIQADRLDLDDDVVRLNSWMRRALGHQKRAEITLIPGVDTTLRELVQDYRLALVTTRGHETIEQVLEEFELRDLFEVVVTGDDVRRLKPHPEPILKAVEQLGLKVENCVMVGDTTADVLSARAAGVHSIGVLCGFGLYNDLDEADLILDSTTDLTQRL